MKKLTINDLNPIPCNIHTAEVSYDYREIKIEKIAISTHSKMKDIKKAIEDEDYGDDNTVVLFKKQYDRIFAPLFAEIAKLNAQIRELKGGEQTMLKGYWPEIIANDGDTDFLMEEFEATDMSIYDFIHGSCAYFAYALAEKFGYDITLVKLYDSDEGRMELCHVYCHTAVNGIDYYIDARGITSNEQQLMDEFDVDLNKDERNGFIETWNYSKNDLIKDGYVSKDSPITNDILSNARIFIETNMDYYTLQ